MHFKCNTGVFLNRFSLCKKAIKPCGFFRAFVGLLRPVGLLIVALDLAMVPLCFTNECTNFGTSLLCGFVCATKRRQYDDAESRKSEKQTEKKTA